MKSTKIKKARIGPFFTENVKKREREIRQLLTTSDLKFEASKQFFWRFLSGKYFGFFAPFSVTRWLDYFSIFGH